MATLALAAAGSAAGAALLPGVSLFGADNRNALSPPGIASRRRL